MTEYVGVLLYIAIATGLGIVILFASYKVRPRRLDLEKATAYECGFEPFGEARSPFDVGFYLVAILFLVFDIETRLLLPWALGGVATGFAGFMCLMLFLAVLILGFVFEWQKGALEWSSQNQHHIYSSTTEFKCVNRIIDVTRRFCVYWLCNKLEQLLLLRFLFMLLFFKKMALFNAFKNKEMVVNNTSKQKLSTFVCRHGASRPHHGYHLVDPSPWPALTALCVMWMLVSLVLVFHQYAGAATVAFVAFLAVAYTAGLWWRDVNREGVLGYHTAKVKNGLHLGMLLFICSEITFFVGLLWAFLHAALMPTIQVGMSWPPVGVVPVDAFGLPKTNTALLLRSYFTANAAKHALDHDNKNLCRLHLYSTIGLGLLFVYCQYLEYTGAAFTFSDSIFGSAFYLTTGFHGLHVILGFLYLAVCVITLNSASPSRSIALDLAVLYWHFVDIVWVALLIIIYVWGCAVPTSEIEACTEGSCALYTVLYERKAHAFAHPTASFNY